MVVSWRARSLRGDAVIGVRVRVVGLRCVVAKRKLRNSASTCGGCSVVNRTISWTGKCCIGQYLDGRLVIP